MFSMYLIVHDASSLSLTTLEEIEKHILCIRYIHYSIILYYLRGLNWHSIGQFKFGRLTNRIRGSNIRDVLHLEHDADL